jgi:hypothetical protein
MGDNLPAVDLGTGRTATAIASSDNGTCALLDNGSVKCWGNNSSGQAGFGGGQGIGDEPNEMGDNLPAVPLGTGRTATAIAAGAEHYCALLDDATVKCWGRNTSGQLGQGDTANRGGNPVNMGDNLPAISLGTGRTATAVAAGGNHSCALLDNETVKCWGAGGSGAIGTGDTSNRGDGADEMGDHLPPISLGAGRTVTAIAAGGHHNCALLDDGTVKCWGMGSSGELGLGDDLNRGDGPGEEMGDHLARVQLGTGLAATSVVAGSDHTCARLANGSLKCWGDNAGGKLGIGITGSSARGDAAGEMGDNLPAVLLQSPPPPITTGVTGTVTETGSGAPVPGAWLALLRTSDFSLAGNGVADNHGGYVASALPGSYYLYLVDPSGRHPSGFFGPPTTVTVTAGPFTVADPTLEPLRGSIDGTVTETGTGTPIAGAWALALSGTTGAPQAAAPTNGSGQFAIGDLLPGDHLMAYVDPTGAHATQFYAGSTDPTGATLVPVTAGTSTAADLDLPTKSIVGTGAALTGRVTESGTATPLPGVLVLALRSSDLTLARAAVTSATGAYSLNVTTGDYRLAFLDPTAQHTMEWHRDQAYSDLALAATVHAPANTNAALDPAGGSMTGTVTETVLGDPLAGAWVVAIGPTGIAGGAITASDGSYEIHGLPPGTYRATFVDPRGAYAQAYWEGATSYEDGTVFAINTADTTTIDAVLLPT